ncbi:toxin-antitoxin system YwqK family antitoxin [Emticicia sp. SJ17W-69]|uniref:toxin-antitoxin system YwqK family antitoxin n=1 Tax=Emticicia sp. SJ17W-69 TaxID=3421657 RepID=UPI003EBD13C2
MQTPISMAMASMARQVLFLSSFFWMMLACQHSKTQTSMLWVLENDPSFTHNEGRLFYNEMPFSGKQYALYTNGDTAKIVSFVSGKQDDWSKIWYENGLLAEQRYFKNGKKEGEHKAWWPDEKPKFLYHFKNDEHEGIQQDWFPNGKLAEIFNYHNGHEEGQQQMWFDDGSLKANYIIKNGRRYGLPGVKNCVSVVENNTFRAKK